MKHPRLWAVVPLLLAPAWAEDFKPVREGTEGWRAFGDLAAYYADHKQVPSYHAALNDLRFGDEAKAKAAGSYLLALFEQSFADEGNNRASWRKTPFWGRGSENDAREFRKQLAMAFKEKATGAHALEAVRWLLESEKLAEIQASGIEALKQISATGSAEIIKRQLNPLHSNVDVAAGAVEEAGRRGLQDLAPEIRKLCTHYRTRIREAARSAAKKLGIDPLPEYKTEEAFTPSLDRQLKDIAAMVRTEIPAGAAFKRLTLNYPPRTEGEESRVSEFSAWVLEEKGNTLRVLTLFGNEDTFPTEHVKAQPRTLAEEAKAMFDVRAKAKDDQEAKGGMSRRGGLTGQFEPGYLSLPEGLVAAWSYARGDKAVTASILFPRMDEMADDRWLSWVVRDYLGHAYQQEMLDEFSHKRDYSRTLSLARHLAKPIFEDYQYQERAKLLAVQLEKRGEDFKTFVLPKPDEWKEQQKNLDRAGQIRYLAEHLRLLNCIQWGQPGGVNYKDDQFAEPLGDGREEHRTPVINPLVELSKLKLEVTDLPLMVPFLADESFMPTYSYWRDFHPSRTLHQVNRAVAGIVNDAAKRDLGDLRAYSDLDEAGKKRHLEKILAWVTANSGRSREELLLASLGASEDWREIAKAASELVHEHNAKALPLLVKRAELLPDRRGDLVEFVYHLDRVESAEHARKWVSDANKETRFYATLILLKHGDTAKGEGLDILRDVLSHEDGTELYALAIEPLLDTKLPAASDLACGILKNKRFDPSDWNASSLLKRLFLARHSEALDAIVHQLDDTTARGTSGGTWEGKYVERKQCNGDYMANLVADWRTGWSYESLAPDEVRAARRKELKDWMRAQFEKIRAGQAPEMDTTLPKIHRGQWQLDAP